MKRLFPLITMAFMLILLQGGIPSKAAALKCFCSGNESRNLMEAAVIAHRRGNLKKAQQLCLAVIQIDSNAEAENWLGVISFQQHKDADALKHFVKATHLCSNDDSLILNKAALELRLGLFDAAMFDCNGVIKNNTELDRALFTRAQLFVKRNNYAKAETDLRACASMQPSDPLVLIWLGLILKAKGSIEEGTKSLEKAEKLFSDRGKSAEYSGFVKSVKSELTTRQ